LITCFIALFLNLIFSHTVEETVVDKADILTEQELFLLSGKLNYYRDTSDIRLNVFIVKNIGDNKITEATQFKDIGPNEIFIFVSLQDRKLTVTSGEHLVNRVTQEEASRIIDEYIVPNFQRKKYFQGLDEATSILMSMASTPHKSRLRINDILPELISLMILSVIIVVLIKRLKR